MAKYRKKPVVIEAVQWTGDNLKELRQMEGFNDMHTYSNGNLSINVLKGFMTPHMWASKGDYIIRGVNGEFYPCKPDVFEKTYEIVED